MTWNNHEDALFCNKNRSPQDTSSLEARQTHTSILQRIAFAGSIKVRKDTILLRRNYRNIKGI